MAQGTSAVGHDVAARLRETATVDLHRRNGFRVLELAVDATPRDIDRRRQVVEMAVSDQLPTPAGPGRALPLSCSLDVFAVRDAMQRLMDPVQRLIDEIFWFWPQQHGESARDPALACLRAGQEGQAEAIWLEHEAEHSDAIVCTHNLALLYHIRALALEEAHTSNITPKGKDRAEACWEKSFRRWNKLLGNDGFWNVVSRRVRDFEDPRLAPDSTAGIRRALPISLATISAQIALSAAEHGRQEVAARVIQALRDSGFSQDVVNDGLALATEPICSRITALCKAAQQTSQAAPLRAGQACRQLLETVIVTLAALDCLLPATHPLRIEMHDQVAEQAHQCQIIYTNKTENWQVAIEVLEVAQRLAASASVRKKLTEDLDDLRAQRASNDHFCGEGYFDLAAPLLAEMDAARQLAKAHQFDDAISRLRNVLAGRSAAGAVQERDRRLVTKALAYCLGSRGYLCSRAAIDEHKAVATSDSRTVESARRRFEGAIEAALRDYAEAHKLDPTNRFVAREVVALGEMFRARSNPVQPRVLAPQATRSPSATLSSAAVWALVLGMIAPFWMLGCMALAEGTELSNVMLFAATGGPALSSALVGARAVYRIWSSAGKFRGLAHAAIGIALAAIVLICSYQFVLTQ